MKILSAIISNYRELPKALLGWYLIMFVSALLIVGPHQADEMGQVTAWTLNLLDLEPTSALPWEHGAAIRSWILPLLYVPIIKFGIFLKGSFDYLFTERIMLIGNVVIWGLLLPLLSKMGGIKDLLSKKDKTAFLAMASCGLWWFLPSMMVRHSSEAMGLVFLCLFIFLQIINSDSTKNKLAGFFSGLAAAMAFWMRFQNAIFVAGYWLTSAYCEWRKNKKISSKSLMTALGVILGLCLGITVDSLCYGQFTISFYNYFMANIVGDVASQFGRHSFGYYIYNMMAAAANPLIILWIPMAAWGTKKDTNLRSISVGLGLFLLVHFLVPHKEMRFLLPMSIPAIILLFNYFKEDLWNNFSQKWKWLFHPKFLLVVAVLNITLLGAFTAFGLKNSSYDLLAKLYQLPQKEGREITIISNYWLYGADFPEGGNYDSRKTGAVSYKPIFDDLHYGQPKPEEMDNAWGRAFAKPQNLKTIYVNNDSIKQACLENPEAYLILNNKFSYNIKGLLAADYPFEKIEAATMPQFFYKDLAFFTKMGWWRRMWHYQMVTCDVFNQIH